MVAPYLPDRIEECVARVDASFFGRNEDPFHVFFDKGILPQVKRSVYANDNFPLVWFVMKYDELFGTNPNLYSEASFQVILAMPTDNNYTQQQREDISFKPRLLPIAQQLIEEIKRDRWFDTGMGANSLKHQRTLLPFWGMGDVNGQDVPNLFKDKFIDAISININGLKIRSTKCNTRSYSVLDVSSYPVLEAA